ALFTAYYPGPGIEGGDKDCTGKKLVPKNQTCAASDIILDDSIIANKESRQIFEIKFLGGNFMEVVSTKNLSSIKLKLDAGFDDKGKAVIKSKSFANVKAEALNEDVYAVAEAIASLQENPIVDILKLDSTSLSK
ncbi:DUF1659 domain-containing protein, partial [Clostridioides difficile]